MAEQSNKTAVAEAGKKGPKIITQQQEQPLEDTVIKIFRCAKVVKGGRR
ncbi:unnamed protein product, partial [marine sediment metagenome]